MLASNPCHVRGGGNARRKRKIVPATLPELETITANLPDCYRLMVLLASWCALRFGELTELRRSDIDLKNGKVMIKRGVVWVGRRTCRRSTEKQRWCSRVQAKSAAEPAQ
jgi:integrase